MDENLTSFTATGRQVAVKTIRRDMLPGGASYRQGMDEDPLKEISVMQFVHSQFPEDPGHRFIVELRDALQNSNYVFEVMSFYSGGDLLGRLPPSGNALITVLDAKCVFFMCVFFKFRF
jgi:hypothetical protein